MIRSGTDLRQERKDMIQDLHGRDIRYLRMSVTDRCNLRCFYCQPPEKIAYLHRDDICTYEELLLMAKVGAELGIEKLRLTGGDPFCRRGLIPFIRKLHTIKGIREIGITTNGTHLLPRLKELKAAGIRNLNISLDTLSEDKFFRITGRHGFPDVLAAIHKAAEEGFRVKVNMVVLKDVNDKEIPSFIRCFVPLAIQVRFIEFMPLCGHNWRPELFLSYEQILTEIKKGFHLQPRPLNGVAREFAVSDSNGLRGSVGLIAPVTRSFCNSCTRLRLTASGELRPCLCSTKRLALLPALRGAQSRGEKIGVIRSGFEEALRMKPKAKPSVFCRDEVHIGQIGG